MTDFYMIRGGACLPECLPIGDECGQKTRAIHLPYPSRVAGEFGRGDFTLGAMFNPMVNTHQADALVCVAPAVNDFISLLLVPEMHTLYDLFVDNVLEQRLFVPNPWNTRNNMAGFVYNVEARVYDLEGNRLAGGAGSVTLDAAFTGVAGSTSTAVRKPVSPTTNGFFVPKGNVVEVGIVPTTMPTTSGVTLDRISGMIGLSAKVRDYQYPMHQG